MEKSYEIVLVHFDEMISFFDRLKRCDCSVATPF